MQLLRSGNKLKEYVKSRMKWGIIACGTIIAAGIVLLLAMHTFALKTPTETVPLTDSEGRLLWTDNRKRNEDIQTMVQEVAYLWPWELETIYEQYGSMTFEGRSYDGGRRAPISKTLLGESLGTCEAVGYDAYNEENVYKLECEVREVKGILPELLVAVQLEADYYVFTNAQYDPPKTLGEFIDSYNLPTNLPLTVFTHYGKRSDSKGRYVVSQECSAEIWNMISLHRDALFYEWVHQDYEALTEKEYISFTAKSESMGTTNLAFYITSTGYIWTNVCGWAYSFEIGTDTAKKIIDYALSNGETAPPIQRNSYLTGTVVEIGDDYFKLDDSILMKNPENGKVFTVYTEDIRVKRYFIRDIIRVGNTVSVEYEGFIYADEPDVVHGAIDIREVMISGEQVLIPE